MYYNKSQLLNQTSAIEKIRQKVSEKQLTKDTKQCIILKVGSKRFKELNKRFKKIFKKVVDITRKSVLY
ncbi:MAG: hypothetical protein GX053_01670 [Tissierella sp.]|nr:hypothetical protein [Tissierella sp.]